MTFICHIDLKLVVNINRHQHRCTLKLRASITNFFSVISDVIDVFNNWRDKIDKAVENIRDFLPDLEILRGLLLQHKNFVITSMEVLKFSYVLIITIHMIKHQKVFSNPYKTIKIS